MARFAGAAKASAILRLPNPRRLATLVAFVHCLEASAQDDALEVLEALLRDLFNNAIKADRKARLRTLKDPDQAPAALASAFQIVLDDALDDTELRGRLFARIPRTALAQALENVNALIRPDEFINGVTAFFHDVAFSKLRRRHRALLYAAAALHRPGTHGTEAAFAWRR